MNSKEQAVHANIDATSFGCLAMHKLVPSHNKQLPK